MMAAEAHELSHRTCSAANSISILQINDAALVTVAALVA
jgi:hypothetical protein